MDLNRLRIYQGYDETDAALFSVKQEESIGKDTKTKFNQIRRQ